MWTQNRLFLHIHLPCTYTVVKDAFKTFQHTIFVVIGAFRDDTKPHGWAKSMPILRRHCLSVHFFKYLFLELELHIETSKCGWPEVCSNGYGHITKMITLPIWKKCPKSRGIYLYRLYSKVKFDFFSFFSANIFGNFMISWAIFLT